MPINPNTLPLSFLSKMSKEQRRPMGKAGMLPAEIQEKVRLKGERDLQQQILSYLRLRGIVVLSPRFGKKTRMTVGWPDLTFSYYGIPCAWEVKFESADLEPEQKKLRAEMLAPPNYWRHAVIRSVQEAKAFMDELDLNLK